MSRVVFTLSLFALLAPAADAPAQTLGTFTWQMQPYCNRVTLTLNATPGGFVAAGSDDRCGAARRAGATGMATFNPDGTIGIAFSIGATDSATPTTVSALVSPANGNGTWTDSLGNSGALVLGAATAGLPLRPVDTGVIDIASNPLNANNICSAAPPVEMTLCGSATGYWAHGGLGLPGLQVWKDADGRVHIRGSVVGIGNFFSGADVFVLAPAFRPRRTLSFSLGMSRANQNLGGRAMVIIYGPEVPGRHGFVGMQFTTDALDRALHFGEVIFSADR